MNATAGSAEAAQFGVRADILGGGIPALSNPTGANDVPIFDSPSQIHNFDLSSDDSDPSKPQFQTGWPQSRLSDESLGNRWLRSDFEEVAYPFVYSLYQNIVSLGGF